jgi:Arc/MetJ family transcription regulator
MRTNIDIDDELLAEAMKATGKKTKKATIEEALQQVVTRKRRRQALNELAGIGWDGDLDQIREGWIIEAK